MKTDARWNVEFNHLSDPVAVHGTLFAVIVAEAVHCPTFSVLLSGNVGETAPFLYCHR